MKSSVFRQDYHDCLNVQSRLHITFCVLPQLAISEHFTFNQYKSLIGALSFNFARHRQLRQHAVCALHVLFRTHSARFFLNAKIQIYVKGKSEVREINFLKGDLPDWCQSGGKSLMRGVVPEALASRKLVVGDDSSEGSETAKSGTDEQERYMRHICLG